MPPLENATHLLFMSWSSQTCPEVPGSSWLPSLAIALTLLGWAQGEAVQPGAESLSKATHLPGSDTRDSYFTLISLYMIL